MSGENSQFQIRNETLGNSSPSDDSGANKNNDNKPKPDAGDVLGGIAGIIGAGADLTDSISGAINGGNPTSNNNNSQPEQTNNTQKKGTNPVLIGGGIALVLLLIALIIYTTSNGNNSSKPQGQK